jgi:hypothetical protein
MSLFRAARAAALALAIVIPTYASAKPSFFRSLPAQAQNGAKAPGIQSAPFVVQFNRIELHGMKRLDEVEIALPNGKTHTLVLDLLQDHGGGLVSWVGHVKDRGNHYRVIVTTGPTGSYGVIDTPEGSFRMIPGGSSDWLVDMEQEKPFIPASNLKDDILVPPPQPKASEPIDLANAHFETAIPGVNTASVTEKVLPTPQATIDVMFVVTRGLANRLGGGLLTRLNFLVTRANTSYTDSEIAMTLRLVNMTVVDYPDDTDDSGALNAITPAQGSFNGALFGNIETIRQNFGADMVTFLRNGSSFGGSGVAWVPSPDNASRMYSTVQGCVSGCESVWIHELGHNMGNWHDRATAAYQSGGGTSYNGVAGYSFGFPFCKSGALTCNPFIANGAGGGCGSDQPECSTNDPSNFSDIMSYFQGTTDTLYKFSNTTVQCVSVTAGNDGIPRACGIASGNANAADTALSMNNNRATISALKAGLPSLVGAVQFTAPGYSGPEGGTITFTVQRIGGSSGAISVQYTVVGNTATAGTDYTVANGTLNWADGDTANKTFNVTILNDGVAEDAESLTATLSNPTGQTGVFLGFPAIAVGLITENFGGSTGGPLPAGYASTDWAVANDQANDGTTSLRSANVHGNFGAPANSDLTYTGTIPAGVIAFAYRVSSYQGLGNLEFSVDGTTVLTVSGETGWRLFFYNLATGGNHTLRWRFANQLPFNCNSAIPAAEGGGACADRAWIDSVSLPTAAPPCVDGDDDNDGIPNCVEATEGRNPGLKDNDIFANARLFSMQQYRDFLNREGDAGGITFWTDRVNGAVSSRGQVVESFFTSEEFQNTVAPVTRLYFAYFLRIPDYTGLQFWINYYKAGNSLNAISNFFAASPEFTATYGALTNAQYVNLIYQNVLGRAPDSGGLAFWLNELDTAARTRGQVMLAFSESPEYRGTSNNMVYVTMMYVGMLRRAPEQGGFDFWVNYLATGNSGLNLINGFLGAPEYRARFLP